MSPDQLNQYNQVFRNLLGKRTLIGRTLGSSVYYTTADIISVDVKAQTFQTPEETIRFQDCKSVGSVGPARGPVMICKTCSSKSIFSGQALSKKTCDDCGVMMHFPSLYQHALCTDCSAKTGLCKHCGK